MPRADRRCPKAWTAATITRSSGSPTSGSSTSTTGTFIGLPEGAEFYEDTQWWRISYTGGTGNDVVLTRLTPTAWQSWQATSFGANTNQSLIASEQADGDNDGVANLLEYACATSPTRANACSIDMPDSTQISIMSSESGKARMIEVPAGQVAMTTDSFVVRPRFFPGGNIGDLAVNGTVGLGSANLALNLTFAPTATQSFFLLTNDGTDAITGKVVAAVIDHRRLAKRADHGGRRHRRAEPLNGRVKAVSERHVRADEVEQECAHDDVDGGLAPATGDWQSWDGAIEAGCETP